MSGGGWQHIVQHPLRLTIFKQIGGNCVNPTSSNEIPFSIGGYGGCFNCAQKSKGCTGVLCGKLKGGANQEELLSHKNGMFSRVEIPTKVKNLLGESQT